MNVNVAILWEQGQPLSVEEAELAGPGPGEVLVEIKAAGVCHSDLHPARGDWRTRTPLALGHEGAGIVRGLGLRIEQTAAGRGNLVEQPLGVERSFLMYDQRPSKRGYFCALLFLIPPTSHLCCTDGLPGISNTSYPFLVIVSIVRPEGADYQWRKIPPGELSIDPEADERLVRVTAWAEAS